MKARTLLAAGLLFGCYSPTDTVTLRVELPSGVANRFKELEVLPHIAELRREGRPGVVVLELKRGAHKVELRLPDACSTKIDLRELPRGTPTTRVMAPLFDLGPSERVVGLDQYFSILPRESCDETTGSQFSYALTSGASLVSVEKIDGKIFSARSAATLPEVPDGRGILAISARQQRALRSELTFRAKLPDGRTFERVLGLSLVGRASGLPDVGTDHPVLLWGDGWQIDKQPIEGIAMIKPVGPLVEFRPMAPGNYELSRADGSHFTLHSGRYDQTPLDCGRADCHAEIAKSAASSPMTHVLASDLGGCHSLDNPACATACHATGEPGAKDGGFADVQQALGLGALPADYDELPHALKRVGGVTCTACHGPSKIPTPDQRLLLLRSDVCAVCHDAPPRYGHVMALAASRMGHADTSAATRENASCARCHTAWGALGRKAPASVEAAGLTCATCHDVHPHGAGRDALPDAAESLLRLLPLPETLPHPPESFGGVSRVCVGCHAPSSNTLRPEASAAALVAGQGGFEPLSGAPLALEGPHARHAKGCLSCHDSGPADVQLGKSHGFRATDASCAKCHQQPPQRDAKLAERARQLLARLDPTHSDGSLDKPWHARYELVLPTPQHTRALRNVLLVLEDPAADVHHPSYAKSLLDTAERFLSGAQP